MRALVLTDTGFDVTDVPEPAPSAGQLLIETTACGICGSDLHAHSLRIRSGSVLGHEFAGTVVELGAGVDAFRRGDIVCAVPMIGCGRCAACVGQDAPHCRNGAFIGLGGANGGMADYVVSAAATSYVMSPDLDPVIGATVEPLAVALNAMERADVRPGERVLVLGGGPIGLAIVLWCRALGVGHVVVSDPVEGRRRLAEACGAAATVNPATESLGARSRELLGGAPDVVVDGAAAKGTLDQCVKAAPYGGRVVVVGIHTAPESFDPAPAVFKSLTVSFAEFYRESHFRHTVNLLNQRRIDPAPMITHREPLEAGPRLFDELKAPNAHGKVLLVH